MNLAAIETVIRWVGGLLAYSALAAEFGEQWQAYCRRVPAFFPRLIKRK
jgi:hypothetical protein